MANGLVFITSTSFTTQASVSIDNCFSATYTHYIVKRNLLGSTGVSLNAQLRVGGVTASGADYRSQLLQGDSTTVAGVRVTGATTWDNALGYAQDTAMGWDELWISNPFEAVRTTAWTDRTQDAVGSVTLTARVYAHDLTTSYDGFIVTPSGGTLTGSISVWALAKS